jgi:hypothetical protein
MNSAVNYFTNYFTKKAARNVNKFRKLAITSQNLNFFTWCFVNKFLLDFSTTYIITSQQIHTPYISLKKDQKKGIYTGCELINVRKLRKSRFTSDTDFFRTHPFLSRPIVNKHIEKNNLCFRLIGLTYWSRHAVCIRAFLGETGMANLDL